MAPRLYARDDPAAHTVWELYRASAAAPTITQVEVTGANKLMVTVSWPAGIGPFYYNVVGVPDGGGAALNYTGNGLGDASDTKVRFVDHKAGTWYSFTARANNGLGWSEPSAAVRFRTPSKPGLVTIANAFVDAHHKLVAYLIPPADGGSRE